MAVALSLAEMKKLSKSGIDDLRKQAEKLTQGFAKDPRFWTLTRDNNGNGSAIIRFLFKPPGEENYYVRIWDYGFQGSNGRWFIEQSPATIEKPDPVKLQRDRLYASGLEADRELAKKMKKRLHFVSNILVLRDRAHPENEGKVFLFKYGQKVWEKLDALSKPDEYGIKKQINPYDLFNGVNMVLRVRKLNNFPNYDESEFTQPEPVAKTDDEIEAIWRKCYSLNELLEEKNFKSPQELQDKLDQVLGLDLDPFLRDAPIHQTEPPKLKSIDETKPPFVVDEEDDDLSKYRMSLQDD
jgi:hypothetical protein